jgi:hypothetical protein
LFLPKEDVLPMLNKEINRDFSAKQMVIGRCPQEDASVWLGLSHWDRLVKVSDITFKCNQILNQKRKNLAF